MATRPAVKVYRKSAIPGVSITQFVDRIPAGCSVPDFERKPVTLSLQEGKNAIFRAVVKGVPTPEVKWKRAKGGMNDPARYQTYFNPATNEFILQINKLTADDNDLYRCFAVNEYGEAVCSAGLRIIQVGFKRKAQQVQGPSADDLKKKLKDYKKMLRKRAPQPQAKQVDKEAVWQLLLHADKKDYERICIKYGISDFRGMLKKLQEIKRDTEIAHGKLIHSIKNQQHIMVTKDGKAVLSLEMELKNSNSKIYLLKDGERLRYGTGDEYRKHCLKQVGKKYTFIVNDVHPEDAGLYQVRVEDVPVFSTELDAEAIPVRFQRPLRDMRCHEKEDAVFECTLRTPCYDAVWLHKTHLLEGSEKHQISVSPDGLTHQLIIKNAEPSDSGMYSLDTGICSSNAWLIVEYAKGKRRQNEEDERDETGWLKGPLSDKERAKKLRQGEYLGHEDHFMDVSPEDGLYRNGREGSQGHFIDDDGRHRLLGQEGLDGAHRNGRMGLGQFSRAEIDGDSMSDGSGRLAGLRDTSGIGAFHGKDSLTGKAGFGEGLEGAGGLYAGDGRGDARAGFKSTEGSDILYGAVLEDTGAGAGAHVGEAGSKKFPYGKEGLVAGTEASLSGKGGMDSLYQKEGMMGTNVSSSAGVGGMHSLSDKDTGLGGASPGTGQRAEEIMGSFHDTGSGSRHVGDRDSHDGKGSMLDNARGEGSWQDKGGKLADAGSVLHGLSPDSTSMSGMRSPYSKDGLYSETSPGTAAGKDAVATETAGGKGFPYSKDDLRVGAMGPAGQGGRTGLLYGPDGLPAGDGARSGAGGTSAGGMGGLHGPDGLPAGLGVGDTTASKLGGFYGKHGHSGEPVAGDGNWPGADVASKGGMSPYGKDGLPAGVGVGGVGAGGFGSLYGKDGFPPGTDVGSLGGVGSPYGKDGLPAGAGVAGLRGVGSPYGKDGLPVGMGAGAGVGGAGVGLGSVGSPYGKDGLPMGMVAGADGGGVGGLEGIGDSYGKDGLPAGAGVAGLGGAGSPYGKDGLPVGAGVAGLGGVGSPYGKDGLPVGAGVAGLGGVGSPYGKDGLPVGAGVAGLGGVGSPYGKDGLPVGAGVAGVGGVGSPYGKDGLPVGAGVAGLGGVGSPYGKDGLPVGMAAGPGASGADVTGAGAVEASHGKGGPLAGAGLGITAAAAPGSPYGMDSLPAELRAGHGGAGAQGVGAVRSSHGKDGLPAGAAVVLADGGGVVGSGGVGSPHGKDGLPAGMRAGVGGLGGVESPYGKDGLPAGVGVGGAGVDGLSGVGSSYGKDGLPSGVGVSGAGVDGLRGVGSPYGKDGLPAGVGVSGAGVDGLRGVGSPYGKDGLAAGAGGVGGAGVDGLGGVGSPYGKDGLPARAGVGGAGVDGLGGVGSPYGKDGLPAGAGIGGAAVDALGGVGSPYGKDGLPAGAGVGGAGIDGLGGVGSPYGKDGLPAGAGVGGAGVDGLGGVGSPYGKDGLPAGAGIGGAAVDAFGGVGSPYGKDGLPAGAGVGGAAVDALGGVGSPYGKDGLPAGAGIGGAGVDRFGGVGSPYGKDGVPAGAGIGGAGVDRLGGVGSPYGKDGLPAGAGIGGAGVDGLGGVGSPYRKDGLSDAAGGAGAAQLPFGGEDGMGSYHSKDALLRKTQGYLGGAGGAAHGRSPLEGGGVSASATQASGYPYGKDSASAGFGAGAGSIGTLGSDERELHSVRGREGGVDAVGLSRESGLDSCAGKLSARDKAGTGAHSDIRESGHKGSTKDRVSLSEQGSARVEGKDSGQLGSYYSKDSAFSGAGSKYYKRYPDARKLGVLGSLGYDQMSGLDGLLASINRRIPDLELKAKEYLMHSDSTEKRRRFPQDGLRVLRCRVNKPLVDVRVVKGEPTELSCTVSSKDVQGTWFKDGLKIKNMEGVRFEKQGSVHKLIIGKVEDFHAGKYRFETEDIKTEASIFVEDPPQVDKVLLKNLTNVPTVTKAGQKVKIKIPFEGQLPIKATWLKDGMELVDDTRIRVDKADTFTMLSISSSERKDCGDYKVRLKNDHGVLEMNLKLVVIDKPEQPTGPIKVIESSSNDITIQWKPPKDDGGKPVQSYIIQMQQVGKEEWVTLGETPKTCTTFTTNKVEQDMGYYFRVRAVNVEGASEALESDEVKAASKAIPGPPDPPEIVSTGKETITISWKVPHRTGSSRIVGYTVQKRKKGASIWVPVTNVPVADRKLKMTNLKMGLQYEFRVAAVNAAGVGEASAPSHPAFARDSTEPPGQVRDLRVSSRDSTSITLTWKTPEPKDGVDVKGYEVEMRSHVNLNWTKCSVLPIKATTYTVKGLQAKELYFLRVRAVNDSGPGEAAELETFVEAPPPVVPPRFLINDRVKTLLVIKAGNTIRVPMHFEASPDPVVTWLKDGHPLPKRASINTEHGATQLLIEAAEFSDTGTYTIELQNQSGNKESFSFQVQVTDIPQSPGPVVLEENVPKTVTVTWEPSASEKWESDLYYTVLKRESQKGLWHTVGDMIHTNKFTYTKLIPGRDYYFRVVAKNCLGTSGPSETVQPWRLQKQKADFQVKQREYRGVNQNQPPRFLVQLKPRVVTVGTECQMSCAVTGYPQPKITWYKDGRDLSKDPTYLHKNVFGVCSLMILGVVKNDEGEYMVEASNDLGRAFSKASLTVKASSL